MIWDALLLSEIYYPVIYNTYLIINQLAGFYTLIIVWAAVIGHLQPGNFG
jgi:hypothetical protein